MKPEWVTEVWNLSRQENILATNSQFDKCRVPIFYNLGITTTGLSVKDRHEVKNIVERHGATYCSGYRNSDIHILIVQDPPTTISEKLKAALSAGKECLTSAWVADSVEKGLAVAVEPYRVNIPANLVPPAPKSGGSGSCGTQKRKAGSNVSLCM